MITSRCVVGTITCLIRLPVASELIIVASAGATAKMQSIVGCGVQIAETSFGGGVMAGERWGIVSAMCSDTKWDIGLSYKYCVHHWAYNCVEAFDILQIFHPPILRHIYHHIGIHWIWNMMSILHND